MAEAAHVLAAGQQHIGRGSLIIDLAGITAADSSAVSVILQWLRQAKRVGCNLHFDNIPASVKSLATLYDVSDLLP